MPNDTPLKIIEAPRATVIASHNDLFRHGLTNIHSTLAAAQMGITGLKIATNGVASLGPRFLNAAHKAVAEYDDFNPDNDPYQQHDFGSFNLADDEGVTHRLYWKIDYYSDTEFQWGSEDPADPRQTVRILTIMLNNEY